MAAMPSGHYVDTSEAEKEKLKASSRTHAYPFAVRYIWDLSALKFIFDNEKKMTQLAMAKHFGIPRSSLKDVINRYKN